jgi:hypothetical protein
MIYSIICSRKDKPPVNFNLLLDYFKKAGIECVVAYDQEGVFQGYDNTIKSLNAKDDDIIILCHDDIQIFSDRDQFVKILTDELARPDVGFVGVAGTTYLGTNAMWWDQNLRQQGFHRGFVFQGSDIKKLTPNYFGHHGNVVVLDGLFLAAKKRTLDIVGTQKPKEFPNGWDYYDLFYTLTAYERGFNNKTVPIILTHYSDGLMRPTWDENRKEFRKMFRLPVRCN